MTVSKQTIEELLNDKSHFTKEEFELINTFITKEEARYDISRAEVIGKTDPTAQTKRFYIDKYGDLALAHKRMLLESAMEEFHAHKEILLQALSILQSMVSNPNFLDHLANILRGEWYGGNDFKHFLSEKIILEEIGKIKELHEELWNIRNAPSLLFIPELYAKEIDQMNKLPAYDKWQVRKIKELKNLLNNNYVQP